MTAQAYSRPAAVQRYLALATLGLVGEQRQRVQDELEEHLLTRADHLHAFGAPYDQALTQALRELGSPLRVCAGLFKVYPMPKIILTSALAALGLSGMLLAQAGRAAEPVPSHISAPVLTAAQLCAGNGPECQDVCPEFTAGQCFENNPMPLLSLSTIRQLAAATGLSVTVSDKTVAGQLYHDVLNLGAGKRLGMNGSQMLATVKQNGETYYRATSVVNFLLHTAKAARLTGLPQPGLEAEGLRVDFKLGTLPEAKVFFEELGFNFVSALLPEVFEAGPDCRENCSFTSPSVTTRTMRGQTYRVQTSLSSGEFVMLTMPLAEGIRNPQAHASYAVATAPVQEGGWAEFQLDTRPSRIVTDRAAIFPKPGNVGNALLVRVTNTPLNDLASGIVRPVQVQ